MLNYCSWLTLINLLLHVRLVASSGWTGPNGTTLIGCQGSPITQQIRRTAWKFCLGVWVGLIQDVYFSSFSSICVNSFLFLAFFLASLTHRYQCYKAERSPKYINSGGGACENLCGTILQSRCNLAPKTVFIWLYLHGHSFFLSFFL